MTTDQLYECHTRRPFRPFAMHRADGRSIVVRHPEILAYQRGGRTVLFVHEDDRAERIDLLLVVSLEEVGDRRSGKRRAS